MQASQRISPTSLYPLFVGIPKTHAKRLVKEHLLNPAAFGTEWALPTTRRSPNNITGAA